MPERVVVISDTHLGFEESNTKELQSFLTEGVARLRPDVLVLNGDILDLWRGGIESVFAQHSDILERLKEINGGRTDVRIIAGNHDWRWSESDGESSFAPPEPWVIDKEWEFSSGDVEFIATHGHTYDYANSNPISNRALCLTNDKQAGTIASLYDSASQSSTLVNTLGSREPILGRVNIGSLANLANPNQLAEEQNKARVDRIERRARERNDRFVIIGHTHVPTVDDGLANSGAWTLDENTYVLVDGGDVSVEVYS